MSRRFKLTEQAKDLGGGFMVCRLLPAARGDWAAQKMGQVAGDAEFIPLPERTVLSTNAGALPAPWR